MKLSEIKGIESTACYDAQLKKVYVTSEQIAYQKQRLARVAESFDELFGNEREVIVCSAPGRTEIGGNHTDHNHGRVLAASINLDAVAIASKNDNTIVRVKSEGREIDEVDISCLTPQDNESGHSASMLRGVCAGFVNRGYKVGGFDAATASDVLSGSGLSSSAAFEVLLGTILNHLYNDGAVSAVEIAQIAQYAENAFFKKPCGLMDQTASSVGSFVTIDFENPSTPVINKVDFDFSSCGHSLCIVDTGGSHSDLTDEYAAVRLEMEKVAKQFGKDTLRDVNPDDFYACTASLRAALGDRAVLRAIHFYADNERVTKQVAALENGDFDTFKALIIESGNSSYMYNQNVFTCKDPSEQPVSLALALSEKVLKGKGAWRVHGGGFAGTIQAFVPNELLDEYRTVLEATFGKCSCHVLSVRPVGGVMLLK